jgi:hypothetical protein
VDVQRDAAADLSDSTVRKLKITSTPQVVAK